jgi:hypothetical protein
MTAKPLSEVANFLEIFVPEVKVPESIQNKSVALQVKKKTMKEIISDLGLEVNTTSASPLNWIIEKISDYKRTFL